MIDTDKILEMVDLRALIERELGQPHKESNGRPFWLCPFHSEKTPSFGIVKKDPRFFKCFGCGKSGTAINWVMDRKNIKFKEACAYLVGNNNLPVVHSSFYPSREKEKAPPKASEAPRSAWSEMARQQTDRCAALLWTPVGQWALNYLHRRGFSDDIIRQYRLGYNPQDMWWSPEKWGLPPDHKKVWLPKGITIPWLIEGSVWRLNVRRFEDDRFGKYVGPAGFKQGLFNADAINTRPVVVCEGAFNALSIIGAAGDIVGATATGSAHGGQVAKWVYRLSSADAVLLAFDRDEAGRSATQWWSDRLDNATILEPIFGDVNEMAQLSQKLVRSWIEQKLKSLGYRIENGF